MLAPLDVVLTGPTATAAHIGDRVDTLTLGASSPGGTASATFRLLEPILSDFLLAFTTVSVYDRRSGEWVGGGRLTDPGKSVDGSGEVWDVTAIGEGPASMSDNTFPRVYIETSYDAFYPRVRNTLAGTGEVGPTPDGTSDDAVVLGAPGGSVVNTGIVAQMSYDRPADTGQELGGFRYTRIAGQTAAGYQVEGAVVAADGTPATATPVSTNFSTAAGTIAATVVGTDFTSGADILRLTMRRSGGAVTIVDDTTWCAFYNLHVAARRKLKDGTNETNAAHGNAYVLASEVVADLLGSGLLPRLDGTGATIDTTTHHFDQLSWIDGITPAGILDELLTAESGYTWHVWEPSAGGEHRFEFVAWPTTIRYDVSVADGFSGPSPASDVYDSVKVRYRNRKGRVKYATRTQTVDNLVTPRQGFLDLGDETGSAADADRAGDQWLADRAAPPNAGTLRIARPVYDRDALRVAAPWQIRPGGLIRVRGTQPYPDSLNASGRDGVTVFRIVTVSWSDSDGAAVLELDTYSPTEARQIERLTNQRRRRN